MAKIKTRVFGQTSFDNNVLREAEHYPNFR